MSFGLKVGVYVMGAYSAMENGHTSEKALNRPLPLVVRFFLYVYFNQHTSQQTAKR